MSLTLDKLIKHLVENGLVERDELTSVCAQLSTGGNPPDPQALARKLVSDQRLTAFQAKAVWSGRAAALVVDEYVILGRIGAGGMGVVFKARHRKMDRIVAVKKLAAAAMEAEEAVERFYREVKAAARLSHPNIVTAYDAREYKGSHYLIMEYVDGHDLASIARQQVPLSVDQVVDYVIQAARGLQYAHASGIFHRDIKPSNLLVAEVRNVEVGMRNGSEAQSAASGTPLSALVKILDMGLARIKDESSSDGSEQERLTSSGQVMGTCDYMAPEQAEDTHQADQRSDVYSLGCTLYRLLAGKPPYKGQSLVNVLIAHREVPTPALADDRLDVPQAVSDVCLRMMAKRPEDRYQSMGEVLEAFGASPAGQPTPPPTPDDPDSKLTGFLKQMDPQQAASPTASPANRTLVADQTPAVSDGANPGSTDYTAAVTMDYVPAQGLDTPPAAPPLAPPTPGKPKRRTIARRRQHAWMLMMIGIGLGISLVGTAIVAFLLYGQTAKGTLVVDPQGEDFQIIVRRQDVTVATIDASTDWRAEVEPDDYELRLEGGGGRVVLDRDTISVIPREETRISVIIGPAATVAKRNYALQFDGRSAYVRIPSLLYDGSHPLTVELQVLPSADQESAVVVCQDGEFGYAKLQLNRNPERWHGTAPHRGQIFQVNTSAPATVTPGLTHVALVWTGRELRIYENGRRTAVGTPGTLSGVNESAGTSIGAFISKTARNKLFTGRVDEIRISSVARYQGDFTPEDRFETDSDTMALYHCDEGGGKVLLDATDNRHHGTVVGATWVPADAAADEGESPTAEETTPAGEETLEHRAARWVFGLGGYVQLTTERGENRDLVGDPQDLPDGAFRLNSITLTKTQFTNDQLALFPPLPELDQLHINTRLVTDEGLANLPTLPAVRLLQLNGSRVTNAGLVHLQKFPALESIFLARTSIGDEGVRHLAQLPRRNVLRNCELDSTKITDQGLALLAGMPNLRDLRLRNTAISDTGLKYLHRAPVLEDLDIRGTRVTANGVAEFKKARPRCKVVY